MFVLFDCVDCCVGNGSELAKLDDGFEGQETLIYAYNKAHLVYVASCQLGLILGNRLGVFGWQGIRLGLLCVFDMYFAAYFEALA
jgi:hypothetical protein